MQSGFRHESGCPEEKREEKQQTFSVRMLVSFPTGLYKPKRKLTMRTESASRPAGQSRPVCRAVEALILATGAMPRAVSVYTGLRLAAPSRAGMSRAEATSPTTPVPTCPPRALVLLAECPSPDARLVAVLPTALVAGAVTRRAPLLALAASYLAAVRRTVRCDLVVLPHVADTPAVARAAFLVSIAEPRAAAVAVCLVVAAFGLANVLGAERAPPLPLPTTTDASASMIVAVLVVMLLVIVGLKALSGTICGSAQI